ncbi:MAG TPA: hypothetical protein VJ869_14310 [Sphaerochaeta sp.]|nr:hypothetical protein [Sphaerochaeta sp.]
MADDNGKNCLVGLQNSKDLERVNMRFEMMIEKLDKQIEGLGVSMNEKFEELNRKITKLDSKFDTLQDTMPAQINKVVDDRFKNNLFTIIKWVMVTVGGAVAIAVVVQYVMNMIF